MTRYQDWMRRYALGQLGVGFELWADTSAHRAAAKLRAIEQARGRRIDSDEIKYRITGPLLPGVIHAAGGVEYTIEKLVAALDAEQQEASAYPAAAPESSSEVALWAPARGDISFELSNLVVWVRTLRERVKSRNGKVGLLPALAKGSLKDQVERHFNEFDSRIHPERLLANFTLHSGPLHSGSLTLRVDPDGQLTLAFPDQPSTGKGSRVESSLEFTYGRDARMVAREQLELVERFMDRLLSSFEQHVPERFRPHSQAPNQCG
jgi:hypothetical protein